jgi:small-conductance mechanosensitive channel
MAFRRLGSAIPEPSERTARRRDLLKRWTIPIVGAVTPVGLIVVNIAAFIVKHLAEFRWTIAILAFVSSLMLNTWAGLNIYRTLQRRRPDHALVHERNQEIVLVLGMLVIIVAAFLTALFCYLGLSSEANLPNGLTFITGVVAILVPIVLQAFFRGSLRRQVRRERLKSVGGLPPTPPPPASQPPPAPPSFREPMSRR